MEGEDFGVMRPLSAVLLVAVMAFALGTGPGTDDEVGERVERRVSDVQTIQTLRAKVAQLTKQVKRAQRGRTRYRRGYLKRGRQLKRLRAELRPATSPESYWIARQIAAANVIGRESAGDPWPNCPDPFDGGGYSWWDTVRCENGGNWMDSPGYYRCGLQFDPSWERRFGRLCP